MACRELTRNWMRLKLRSGWTVAEIAVDRGIPVARVCRALEQFQLNYRSLRAEGNRSS